MGLVDLMGKSSIMLNLIIRTILRDKASLGAQTTGFQGVAGSRLGLTCLVFWTHNNRMLTSRVVCR